MSSSKEKIPLIYYKGFPFPGYVGFDEKVIQSAVNYCARDGDYVLSSYPKTGTNWMSYIIWLILHKGIPDTETAVSNKKICPFLERLGTEVVDALDVPRFYMNHLPYKLQKINGKAKYIYIYRNPEDTVASFYHFHNSLVGENTEFGDFFEAFMSGNVPYGDFFDHVLSYYHHKNDKNLYIACYEKMKANPGEEILKLGKFLGTDCYELLAENKIVLDSIVEQTSFDSMKKKFDVQMDLPEGEKRKIQVFRKGIVGDGKNLVSEEQISRLKATMLKKMEGTEFIELWS